MASEDEKCKTLADLVAEYRNDADAMDRGELYHPTTEYLRRLLDRIEAIDSADAWRSLYSPGNAAAMREACANIAEYAKSARCHTEDGHVIGYLDQIENWCRAALSAPARNCDRFNTGNPMKDAEDAYGAWQQYCDDQTIPPSCKTESSFKYWLLAPAAERKG